MSAANRRIVSPIDWTFASPKAPWTTSRKAEMVGARSRKAILLSFTNHIFSIQHPDGLRLCHISMADHVETGHEEVGKIGPLCCHVSGMNLPKTLTLASTGHGHRNLNSGPNTLEIPRQRQRRTVLLAPRHVGHLVLLRSCRHHHRAMRPGAAGAGQRCPFDAPFDGTVEAAGVHG
jgi:hypothetical protein